MASTMTREQMIEKLATLKVGSKIVQNGKTYTVMGISHDVKMKMFRTDVGLLEEGKPETYQMPGRYQAEGKMLTFSNIECSTWYAQPCYMNWEMVG